MTKTSKRFFTARIDVEIEEEYFDSELIANVIVTLEDGQTISFVHSSDCFYPGKLPEEEYDYVLLRELKLMMTSLGHRIGYRIGELPTLPIW